MNPVFLALRYEITKKAEPPIYFGIRNNEKVPIKISYLIHRW